MYESQGYQVIAGWERDYKQLKRMRWIRNRLVHETNSFEDDLVDVKDIEWLQTFYCRIIECTDPFSLLYQSDKVKEKTVKQQNCSEGYFSENKPSLSQNCDLSDRNIFMPAVITAAIIIVGIVLIGIVVSGIMFSFFEN